MTLTPGTRVDEVADGIYRLCTQSDVVPGGFTFNQFLILDDEPLLFHTGLRAMFPVVKEAIATVMPLEKLRYIAFSHVEADECGALNQLLAAAPLAVPVCSRTAAMVSVNDLADRPPKAMTDGETLRLGRHAVQWHDTPHLPHSWESGLMTETTTKTFLCGDLFTHAGATPPPVTESDVLGPSEALRGAMNYYSQAGDAAAMVRRLAALKPRTLALMHGSSWKGDGGMLLNALADKLAPTA
ncbi:MAG TPA: MBL fold metallo-hydrolase [Planctomycetota bacterium]|nr:MBL fold metallo-hydrolase [Planctomycetota bacterium]